MHYFRYVFFLNCLSLYFVWKSPANLLTHFPKNFCIPSFIFFLHISITLSKVHQLQIKIHFFCFQKHTKKKQITSMFWINAEHTSGFRQLVYVYNATVPVYSHTYMTLRKKFDERVLPSAYRFYHISIHFLFVFLCLHLNLYQFCVFWKFRRFRKYLECVICMSSVDKFTYLYADELYLSLS